MSTPAFTLSSLLGYRHLVMALVTRELRMRFQGSVLGPGWLVLQPLALIFMYTVVFSSLMGMRLPGHNETFSYSIYLCAGLLPWTMFSEIVQRSKNLFLENATLIKKTPLATPVLLLPVLLTAVINLLLLLLIFELAVVLSSGRWIALHQALLPLLILAALALATGFVLAVLNVFFRDVGLLIDIVLQLGFWATPIVYQAKQLPVWAQSWTALNPVWPVVEQTQRIFTGAADTAPGGALLYPAGLAAVMALLGLWLYRRMKNRLVDEL